MQSAEAKLIDLLKNQGVNFTASLPCEKIRTLLQMVEKNFQHVPLTREEEGVGICAGAALAGKRPAMFVQSSGVGNMINALLSLTGFYELPLALLVSHRGFYQEKIAAQVPMGSKLPAILSGAGIGSTEIVSSDDLKKIEQDLPTIYSKNKIYAFLMSPKVWEDSNCELQIADCGLKDSKKIHQNSSIKPPESAPSLTRYDIIKTVAPYLTDRVVVSNLGWPSKELYAIKHQPSNFYMLGSMGMATPIGLGISITSAKEVIVIDGDGSLLMNPGSLATAASLSPKNLTILGIDNGAYGSTGNQPTLAGSCVDLELVARGFGFKNTVKVASKEEIVNVMKQPREGLTFIHALAKPGNKDVPNIPLNHLEIKKVVQGFLRG